MKKHNKLIAGIVVAALAVTGVATLAACGSSEPAAELVETYYSNTRMKALTLPDQNTDYLVLETFSVSLYSDNTYVCNITITESLGSAKFEEGATTAYRTIRNQTAYTRYGTYEIEKNEDAGTFSLTLGEASRIIYAFDGGHGNLDPGTGYSYVDSADPATIENFEAQWEWFGNWEHFSGLVGAEVELEGSLETHLFAENSVIFEYRTPNFAGLPIPGADQVY